MLLDAFSGECNPFAFGMSTSKCKPKRNIKKPRRVFGEKTKNTKRHGSGIFIPSHPLFLESFKRRIEASAQEIPVLEKSNTEYIHLFTTRDATEVSKSIIFFHDRKVSEWIDCEKKYNNFLHFPFLVNDYKNLVSIIKQNIGLVITFRKLLNHYQFRRNAKRTVGCPDLYTTEKIPKHQIIQVQDNQSKTTYAFHTQTAEKILLRGLSYSTYGIAMPHMPKNPYTNLEWNIGQLISITNQIIVNNIKNNHKFPNEILCNFRNAQYRIDIFKEENSIELQIDAAHSFFKNVYDPDVKHTCNESIQDMYDSFLDSKPTWNRVVRQLVCDRKPPEKILKRWDKLILSFFIYSNHELYTNGFLCYDDYINGFKSLDKDTILWWRSIPRQILPRRQDAITVVGENVIQYG